MKKERLVVSTITSDMKGNRHVLKKSLYELSKKASCPVLVADGGSSESFVRYMEEDCGFQVLRNVQGGVFEAHRTILLEAASRARAVLYTEPDKQEWFKKGLVEATEKAVRHQDELYIIGRTESVMRTFPKGQRFWERDMSRTISQRAGIKGDYAYGPRVVPSGIVEELKLIPQGIDLGWGALSFLVGRAIVSGTKINFLNSATACPPDQRIEDPRLVDYRREQTRGNLAGFFIGLGKS